MKYVDYCYWGGKHIRLCCFYRYLDHVELRFAVMNYEVDVSVVGFCVLALNCGSLYRGLKYSLPERSSYSSRQ